MFKKLFVLLLFIGSLSVEAQIKTPAPSPFSKTTQMVGLTEVTLEYSRPSMKGRKIFGGLESFDKIWRTGANSRTKITFSDDVTIDSKELKKGTMLFSQNQTRNHGMCISTQIMQAMVHHKIGMKPK